MIVEFKTEKAEGIFVKVPDDARNFKVMLSFKLPILYMGIFREGIEIGEHDIKLPSIDYKILGLTKELEEKEKNKLSDNFYDWYYKFVVENKIYDGVTSINQWKLGDDIKKWYKETNERTGNWLILIKNK